MMLADWVISGFALRLAKWVKGIMDGLKIDKNTSRLYSETLQLI